MTCSASSVMSALASGSGSVARRASARSAASKTKRSRAVVPNCLRSANVCCIPMSWGTKQASYRVRGVAPVYAVMRSQWVQAGRFPDAEDLRLQRRVVFIGSEVARKMFGNVPPVGQRLRIGGMSFEVVGVQREKVQLSNYMGSDKESVYIPYTTAGQLWNTGYTTVMVYQAVDASKEEQATRHVKEALGRRLGFNPGDERALRLFGSSQTAQITQGITLGLKLVLGFIGVLTLAIGGIGVMNIMFVSVTERTREIGIRKALGARRGAILLQFLLEGVATAVAGGTAGVVASWALVMLVSPRPFLSELLDDRSQSADIHLVLSAELLLRLLGHPDGRGPGERAGAGDPSVAARPDSRRCATNSPGTRRRAFAAISRALGTQLAVCSAAVAVLCHDAPRIALPHGAEP